MKEIHVDRIIDEVSLLCRRAATELPEDVENALKQARNRESSALAQYVLDQIVTNAQVARTERLPLCQDTGYAVLYVEFGQELHIVGGDLNSALQEGVRQGYRTGHLRASVVAMPFGGPNTGDNTPAIVHYDIVPGDRLAITILPKGMGCENTSRIQMAKPSDGWEGVKAFIVDTVKQAGPNACPPLIVGVGIGGTFDYCAYLAKKAVLRKVGERNESEQIAQMEEELENRIRALNVGPQGLGGDTTAMGVHLLVHPCHIASIPVAVNIQCHSARQKTAVI